MATLNTVDSSFSCMIEGKSFKLPFIEGRVFLGSQGAIVNSNCN